MLHLATGRVTTLVKTSMLHLATVRVSTLVKTSMLHLATGRVTTLAKTSDAPSAVSDAPSAVSGAPSRAAGSHRRTSESPASESPASPSALSVLDTTPTPLSAGGTGAGHEVAASDKVYVALLPGQSGQLGQGTFRLWSIDVMERTRRTDPHPPPPPSPLPSQPPSLPAPSRSQPPPGLSPLPIRPCVRPCSSPHSHVRPFTHAAAFTRASNPPPLCWHGPTPLSSQLRLHRLPRAP